MDTKHTAGQWTMQQHSQFQNGTEIVANGKVITTILNQRATDSEGKANAKIMAAAPELLQTLTDYIHSMLQPDHVEKWYNQYKDDETANRVLVNAITAIKAATI